MRRLHTLLLLGLFFSAVPSMATAQNRGLLEYQYVEGSITKSDPVDEYGRRYVEYRLSGVNVGDTVKISVAAKGFTPRVAIYSPGYSPSEGTMIPEGYYVYNTAKSTPVYVRLITDKPGDTGKYIIGRTSGMDYGQAEFPAVSRVGSLTVGANLHHSTFQLEGDDWAWTGAGYAVRGAFGFGDHVVLHGEYQSVLAEPDDGAPASVAGEIWELQDIEVGARLYLLSAQSHFRPYVTGAYAFRKAEVRDDQGIKGPGFVAGGGLEFFFLESLALEIGGTYSWGDYDKFYIGDDEVDPSEVGESPFPATHRRISFGVAWHM